MDIEKIFLNMIIIILILTVLALAIFNIKTQNNKEGFTELYFVGNLSKEAIVDYEYPFSFAIHNLENKKMTYHYALYIKSSKIDEEYITLDHDKVSIINQYFILKNESKNNTIPISVKLLDKEQEIHFWVNVK